MPAEHDQNLELLLARDRFFHDLSALILCGNLQEILRFIVAGIGRCLRFDRVRLYMVDEDQEALRVVCAAGHHPDIDLNRLVHPLDVAHGAVTQVSASGEARLISDAGSDPASNPEHAKLLALRGACAVVPLPTGETWNGVIVADNSSSARAVTEDDVQALTTFANQAGLAYRIAKHRGETDQALSRRVRDMALLQRISRHLVSTIDLEVLAKRLVTDTLELLDAGAGSIYLRSSQGAGLLVEAEGGTPGFVVASREAPGPLLQRIVDAAQPLCTSRRDAAPVPPSSPATQAILAVPLVFQEEVVGALLVEDDRVGHFSEEQEQLLLTLAAHAAAVLHHARVHGEKDRSLEQVTQQLTLSEKMASLGLFAGGIAHQLNNSLSVITTSVLNLRRNPDRQERHLCRIEEAAREAATVIRNLRALASNQPLEMTPLDLSEVFKTAAHEVCEQFPRSSVQLLQEFEDRLPPCLGNRNSLKQVFINLLNNAYQAMPRGGTLRLRTGREDDGRTVWAQVIDSGPGIGPDVAAQVFDPFFTTRHEEKGMGLGLSLCHKLVKQHGGDIDLKSLPGETVFTVRLPAIGGTGHGPAE